PGGTENLFAPALDAMAAEIAPVLRQPRLNIFPTGDGYRLAWDCITFSRNPFGVFLTQVDAQTGEILSRENQVRAQLPYTADIYPSTPGIANYDTGALKLVGGVPEGLERVNLRNYNPGMNETAVAGVMSGKHALVRNVLATQQPFAQAAQGTFHFRQNNLPLEAQPNEADDLAEPAEHFDSVNMYFFINYLLEYVDDIHKRGDSVHNRIGTGDFPDNYQNSDRPLVGLIHFPNAPGVIGGPIDRTNADTILRSAVGLDNAFSVPVSQTIDTPAGPQKIVVNPTAYGHGYLLNDLAKDGPVAYHEGMHSISTPIAGLEGEPEGGGLNEAQADLWAYAITGDDAIGAHSIKGARIRQRTRSAGGDPESLAWIRSARSSLKYSELGTYRRLPTDPPGFEEHRDGEIFAATMFELLELMKAGEPQMQFKRPALQNGQVTRTITRGQNSWERIFLGSLYILGATAPDTYVKARDAVLMADRILYSSDPTNLDAPGQHEALIWQVFAAREMGVNAAPPQGGAVTISTAVPQFALEQARTGAPQGVTLEPASAKTVRVSWQPVEGAYAYQVFKRKIGTAGTRQRHSTRPYFDGDQATTGWTHVSYTSATNYEDKGKIQEVYAPAGIKSTDDAQGFNEMFDTEYAVRAISLNPNRQSGFSDLSGSASFSSSIQDVSSAMTSAISNVSFANGIFEFDNKLTNNGIPGNDSTAYAPISFKVVRISNPTVTVENADNGGNGRDIPGVFLYNQTLRTGQTSAAKRLKFRDPQAQMFTFDALVTARVRGASVPSTGSQPYDGDGNGRQEHTITTSTDTYNGIIVLGAAGQNLVSGVDYVDVPFVAKEGSFGVTGVLSSTIPCDLDFQLRDSSGNVLATSGNIDANEEVSGLIQPGRTYIYRVVGFGNGPTPFKIVSTQYASGTIGNTGTASFGQPTPGFTATQLVRFTVNPLTGAVSGSILR
ncbi:MAG: M36 family metallopeptidase, partial [Acidobacteriota bacterium]|nr:M36 family metallopeptidase [Acidobacteriota bacterium]